MASIVDIPTSPEHGAGESAWSYETAFSRNLGLISRDEQQKLRDSRIAIPGMGGVGGIHLMTLTRLGIGAFRIADPDAFEAANFNRQYGADVTSIGRAKADVMAKRARAINPELTVDVVAGRIHPENVDQFLSGVDVLVDGIDFFAFKARRLLFQRARELGIWTVTAGPIGFSTAWMTFDPNGMSFDEYFGFHDGMDELDLVAAFIAGLTPKATHRSYLDMSQVDPRSGRGPSVGLACHLCSGVAATEVTKILLGRGRLRPAPWNFQFDAYHQVLRKTHLRTGNRSVWQRIKQRLIRRHLQKLLAR